MRYQGRLTSWNDDKGYGFVTPNGGGDRAFVHITAFPSKRHRPVQGDLITYVVVRDARNRLRADEIRFPGRSTPPSKQGAPRYAAAAALIGLLSCVLVALALAGKISVVLPFIYVLVSGITFIVYGFDKSAAMNSRRRTPESTLHLLSVLGGWPGALVAQQMFRHKSRKLEFQIVFWLTVLLNCGVLGWSATQTGAAVLRATFGATQGNN
jgi:uncharacterized membrane protein YsdA (DUF1294 family)/cold shock CspA family protein